MKLAKPFKQLSALTLFSSLGSTTVHAHPGHIADQTIHSLMHIEHIIPLVAAGAIAFAVYTLLDK
jgi:hypothetical protein